mgnify:CR=1 FL=1
MLRKLLATTAIAAVMTTGAIAETVTTPQAGNNAAMDRNSGVYEFELHTLAPDATTGILASNMIGKSVMTGEADDAETIGDINDVVIGRDGEVRAVIVGVGGFLGIAEKDVALEFDRLSFVSDGDRDDQFEIVADATREDLENAPTYERPDYIPEWMSTSAMKDGMDKAVDGAKNAYETVQTEAIDPARKRIDEAMGSASNEPAEDMPVTGEATTETAENAPAPLDDTASTDMAMTQIDANTISTDELIGTDVETGTETDIGEIAQVLIDEEGNARAVVIDVGGFLGFGEKPVAVAYDSLKMFKTDDGELIVTVPFTKSDLENAESFDQATFKSNPNSVTLIGN